MKDFLIYIPTRGRIENQKTLNNLPSWLHSKVRLVTPEKEAEALAQCYPHMRKYILPVPVQGIGKTRQWIVENSKARYGLFLDDDMDFCYRLDMASPKLVILRPDDQQMTKLFEWTYEELKTGALHVGISARQGNNHVCEEVVEATRMNNAYAYDLKRLEKTGVRFDALPLMEDFYVTLGLLTRGYVNRVTYRWCWNQSGSNKAGGCSTYRTGEMQAKAAKLLQKAYPAFVTLVEKESKSNWSGMKTRTDVRIQWKKALNSSGGKRQ